MLFRSHQSSSQAIVNWQSFNIGSAATVNVHQPGVSASLLNRVTAGAPSKIFGSLRANGQVFLVNPSGIIFGNGARVDVGGLVASSLSIKDEDFLTGNLSFSGGGSGGIENHGFIRGGNVALLGPEIRNDGEILATVGSVGLASGDKATLTFEDNNLISIAVEESTLKSAIENAGRVVAENGSVMLRASAADSLVDGLIKSNPGATGLVSENGTVRLVSVSGSIAANTIEIDAGSRGEIGRAHV